MNTTHFIHVRRSLSAIACAAFVFGLSACSGGEGSGADSANRDSADVVPDILSPAQTDSVAMLLGTLEGCDEARNAAALIDSAEAPAFDRQAYISGLRAALSDSCASVSFSSGLQAGSDIILQIEDLRGYGVDIDRKLLLAAIEKALMADSVTDEHIQQINAVYNALLQRAYGSVR